MIPEKRAMYTFHLGHQMCEVGHFFTDVYLLQPDEPLPDGCLALTGVYVEDVNCMDERTYTRKKLPLRIAVRLHPLVKKTWRDAFSHDLDNIGLRYIRQNEWLVSSKNYVGYDYNAGALNSSTVNAMFHAIGLDAFVPGQPLRVASTLRNDEWFENHGVKYEFID